MDSRLDIAGLKISTLIKAHHLIGRHQAEERERGDVIESFSVLPCRLYYELLLTSCINLL